MVFCSHEREKVGDPGDRETEGDRVVAVGRQGSWWLL